jgi:hypothetical protein
LSKFDDDSADTKFWGHFGVEKGKDFIIVLNFNENMILQESQLLSIIGIEIEGLVISSDFSYTIEW